VTNGHICDRHNVTNFVILIHLGRHKKSQKELAKTRLLKLSKAIRIVTAFHRHKMESQMITIVTVTMRYLGAYYLVKKNVFLKTRHKTKPKRRLIYNLMTLSILAAIIWKPPDP
jgi:hypothetical protein